jgi:hypothetical protein
MILVGREGGREVFAAAPADGGGGREERMEGLW